MDAGNHVFVNPESTLLSHRPKAQFAFVRRVFKQSVSVKTLAKQLKQEHFGGRYKNSPRQQ